MTISVLAVAIASLAAVIAWGQWYTARQKLVLDLFDKRITLVDDLVETWRKFYSARSSGFKDFEEASWQARLQELRARARFLFGSDVYEFLGELVGDTVLIHASHGDRTDHNNEEWKRDYPRDERIDRDKRFYGFRRDLYDLCAPYLMMDQKLPKGPVRWVRDRWENRPLGQ